MRNRYFCWFGAFEKAYFLAPKSYKNLCFFNMLLETVFFKFLYQNVIFGLQLGPQLGVKSLHFLHFHIKSPKNPMGTPKARQSLPWTPPGPSENLENEPLDIENLHFSYPIVIENTKK